MSAAPQMDRSTPPEAADALASEVAGWLDHAPGLRGGAYETQNVECPQERVDAMWAGGDLVVRCIDAGRDDDARRIAEVATHMVHDNDYADALAWAPHDLPAFRAFHEGYLAHLRKDRASAQRAFDGFDYARINGDVAESLRIARWGVPTSRSEPLWRRFAYVGRRAEVGDGSYEATRWFKLYRFPVLPVSSARLIETTSRPEDLVDRIGYVPEYTRYCRAPMPLWQRLMQVGLVAWLLWAAFGPGA